MQSTALEILEELARAETPPAVWRLLHRFGTSIGTDWVQYMHFDRGRTGLMHGETSFPEDWVERYKANSYVAADPAAAHCSVSLASFVIEPLQNLTAADTPEMERRVVADAYDLGLRRGFVVPSWTLNGESVAGITFASNNYASDFLDPEADLLQAMHLIACAAHHRYQSLSRIGATEQVILTPRERDVLSYAAMGMRTGRIAERLGIAEVTVDLHFSTAAAKLGAHSRAQAVAEAVVKRIIRL